MAIKLNLEEFYLSTIESSIVRDSGINRYTIRYISNLEETITKYNIRYTTDYIGEVKTEYHIYYDSIYGDRVQKYTIKYFSNREVKSYTDRYQVIYYTTYGISNIQPYTIRYTSISPASESYRAIYKVRFDTTGSKELFTRYTIKYTKEFFKDRMDKYKIVYTSDTPYKFETEAALLRNAKRTSVLFCIKGTKEMLQDSLFVFSNLPRYQLVQMGYLENKSNITWIEDLDSVKKFGIFREGSDDSQEAVAYILVRDVEELNNMSLDIYNKDSLVKLNRAKSHFFNLASSSFVLNLTTVDQELYQYINYDSLYYDYTYLNFVEKSLSPSFRIDTGCCFNIKINSKNQGGLCSPF